MVLNLKHDFYLGATDPCLWTLGLYQPEMSVPDINWRKPEMAVIIQQSLSAPLPACTSEAGRWCPWGGRRKVFQLSLEGDLS